jgi:hypothetical protein
VHTPATTGPVRALRLADSVSRNPTTFYAARSAVLAYGEAALFLSVMGDPVIGTAPSAYVDSFFEREELPYALGWTPPKSQTNFATLTQLVLRIESYANDPFLEITTITSSECTKCGRRLAQADRRTRPLEGDLLRARHQLLRFSQ